MWPVKSMIFGVYDRGAQSAEGRGLKWMGLVQIASPSLLLVTNCCKISMEWTFRMGFTNWVNIVSKEYNKLRQIHNLMTR